MIVRWNENRVLYIPLIARYTDEQKKKMTQDELSAAIKPTGAVTLLTGINEITDAEWELALPDVAPMLKRKANEIDPKLKGRIALEALTFKVGTTTVTEFTKLPPQTCRKLLAETFSPFTLQKWEQTENRESVRVDLKKRMEELGVEAAKAGLDEEDEAAEETTVVEPKKPGPAPKQQEKK